MSQDYPKISLVMSSFSRSALLDIGLASLLKNPSKFEFDIVVVNDGLDTDDTRNVCLKYQEQLSITYIFSGQRNKAGLIKRNPAIPNNIAIKQSTGDILILTCPEIFHLNNAINLLVEPLLDHKYRISAPSLMYFDDTEEFTKLIKSDEIGDIALLRENEEHIQMPFLLGIWKERILEIGGYDEDLIGYAGEDTDFMNRLIKNKCRYVYTDARIVHLYHGPRCPEGNLTHIPEYLYNKRLSDSRRNKIVRNVNKDWGVVDSPSLYNDLTDILIKELAPVPKIVHLYWDNSPMSYLQTLTITTFHKKNPDWEIRIYIPKQKYLGATKYIPDYTGKDYFPEVIALDYVSCIEINLGEYNIPAHMHNILRSDVFRYHIMYNVGGVWSDFDVLWLKSMSYFFKNIKGVGSFSTKDMGTCACRLNTIDGWNNISILVSRPKHPLYRYLIEESELMFKHNKSSRPFMHQQFGSDLLDRLFPTLSVMQNMFPDIIGLPYKTFFPYSIRSMDQLYRKRELDKIDDMVMGVHWFNGHELSKDYVNGNMVKGCTMDKLVEIIEKGLL